MSNHIRNSKTTPQEAEGITTIELLIVVVILGIAASVSIVGMNSVLRRERINSVALEVAGWLEEVRNLAARRVDSSTGTGGCAITLSPGSSMTSGAVLASVETACSPRDAQQLRVPGNLSGSTVSMASTNGNSIIFTPRGLWIASPAVSGALEIKLLLDGGGPLRCVRLSETLGSVDIGRANATTVSASCSDYVAL
ncbi:Prepilin-type N-terminal cleavage/methylation domain protein [Cyanobium sp. NIES-981]|nr:Prepilin-type N-terminal cleavage/methylation domain protein [Cyanobium sp. NIES-981]